MKATIIVPVKDSLPSLLRLIESLKSQDMSLVEKIIVVENGSNQITHLPDFDLLKLPKGNRSKARNEGARAVQSDILIFLDADVELGPAWIKEIIGSFEEETLAVQSQIIPSSSQNDLLQKVRKSRIFFKNGHSFFSIHKEDSKKVVINSAAFAIRRSVFEQLGGFDPHLVRHEDLDLTQRLLGLEGHIKAISSSHCRVYFHSGLWDYFMREFDCGLQIVRYHEKWSSRSLMASMVSLSSNLKSWLFQIARLKYSDTVASTGHALEFFYLSGNLVGIFKKIVLPYPGKEMPEVKVRCKLEFK